MAKFRKRPVVIEAMRWPHSAPDRAKVYEWMDPDYRGWPYMPAVGTKECYELRKGVDGPMRLAIPTLEGVMEASPGDWIIKGVKGEFYPCKPDIFDATYEPVQ